MTSAIRGGPNADKQQLFSSLYSMLPQSKIYFIDGGYSPQQASFLLIGLFLTGVVVIRVVSNVLHRFIPSHVVDCDHKHEDEEEEEGNLKHSEEMAENQDAGETTPLLSSRRSSNAQTSTKKHANGSLEVPDAQRPSRLGRTLSRTYSKYIQGQKENCDESGPCKGFSDPCGRDCFRFMQRRTSSTPTHHLGLGSRQPTWSKASFSQPILVEEDTEAGTPSPLNASRSRTQSQATSTHGHARIHSVTHHVHHAEGEHNHAQDRLRSTSRHSHQHSDDQGQEHHHHVPTNAFMSIGLQTSIAIALHKAPEGFITYATNHANPTLGFAVFMALFIHNISEGFAMSLPLYLALNSRVKAIVWSSFLGGASQPLGAGVAALWFKVAQRSQHGGPDESVYGGMFAITAGIMTSVALSLFSESLQLSHKKGICIAFAFIGMGVLGVSTALTAK